MNQKESVEILIVGAGISGLILGKKLSSKNQITLFEKSRGIGGRIATRRKDLGAWDHGITFVSPTDAPSSIWEIWAPFLNPIPNSLPAAFASRQGLTEIAKGLAAGLRIRKECKISQVAYQENIHRWRLIDENQEEHFGDVLVLAVPVPQAVELLRNSNFSRPLKMSLALESISYFSQLVLLGIADRFPESNPEVQSVCTPFERIIDNGKKGVLNSENFFTGYLSPQFSREHFDDSPETLLPMLQEFLLRDYGITTSHLELKKWRYSQCSHPCTQSFSQGLPPYDSLFCIGDGFSGGGFQGAIQSALALASKLS